MEEKSQDEGFLDPRVSMLDQPSSSKDIQAIFDVPVRVTAVLGRSRLTVQELLRLAQGSVVELDRRVGESIDIYVSDKLVARGEIVLIDNNLGITVTEIVKSDS